MALQFICTIGQHEHIAFFSFICSCHAFQFIYYLTSNDMKSCFYFASIPSCSKYFEVTLHCKPLCSDSILFSEVVMARVSSLCQTKPFISRLPLQPISSPQLVFLVPKITWPFLVQSELHLSSTRSGTTAAPLDFCSIEMSVLVS
jgi:hypothetical protein